MRPILLACLALSVLAVGCRSSDEVGVAPGAVGGGAGSGPPQVVGGVQAVSPVGAWLDRATGGMMRFDTGFLRVVDEEARAMVCPLVSVEAGAATYACRGQRVRIPWKLGEAGELITTAPDTDKAVVWAPTEPSNPLFDPSGFKLPLPMPVEQTRRAEIGAELERRLRAVDASDTRLPTQADRLWLTATLEQVGWPDVARFGLGTTRLAWALVYRSLDPVLTLSALPGVTADVDAGLMPFEPLAMLVDRAAILMGRPQVYGTELSQDDSGQAFVIAVVDASKLDAVRANKGLPPMQAYFQQRGLSVVPIREAW